MNPSALSPTPVFAQALQALAERLRSSLKALNAQAKHKAVHDIRVAARRLRVALRALAPLFKKRKLKQVRRSLRKLLDELSPIRDAELLAERVEALSASGAIHLRPLHRSLLRQVRATRQKSARGIRRKFDELPTQIRALTASMRLPRPWKNASLKTIAGELLLQRLEDLKSFRGISARSDGETLHSLRIALKKLRYTAILFEPLKEHLKPIWQPARAAQELLGHLHDTEIILQQLACAPEQVPAKELLELQRATQAEGARLRQSFGRFWENYSLDAPIAIIESIPDRNKQP